ncbi:DUF302 domain-containing protein [Paraburkholderia caribensis]|uniref:DUF302 domain-containing protein n=1 Tax=Paraburkholderia caribensis TaxID=75105 RepID=UPI0034D3730B
MKTQISVEHVTIETQRSFEDVVKAFESQVGSLEVQGWHGVEEATDRNSFEKSLTNFLGPSGFTRFLTVDHGRWMALFGKPCKFMMYTIGNPLIAFTMTKHEIEAGLDVPVRVAIYEHETGETRFVYNTPSSLMSSLKNKDAQYAAIALDNKLEELAESVTGVRA